MKVPASYQRLRIVRKNRKSSNILFYNLRKKKTKTKDLTDRDLEENVFVDLQETDTDIFIMIPSKIIA